MSVRRASEFKIFFYKFHSRTSADYRVEEISFFFKFFFYFKSLSKRAVYKKYKGTKKSLNELTIGTRCVLMYYVYMQPFALVANPLIPVV